MIKKEGNTYSIYGLGTIHSVLNKVSYEELVKLYADMQDIFEADYREHAFNEYEKQRRT